jgi:RimJ/RimL family protein N-acetyltransferase
MTVPLPRLFHGKKVRLAQPNLEDAAVVARFSADGEYRRLMDSDYARGESVEEARQAILNMSQGGRSILFHLRTVPEEDLIGFVSLHDIEWNNQNGELSVGIWDPAYQDRGYGSEALQLILNYAFYEINLFRVGLTVIASNARAIHVYQKHGFREEGRMRQVVHRDGKRVDLLMMSILRDEYVGKKKV